MTQSGINDVIEALIAIEKTQEKRKAESKLYQMYPETGDFKRENFHKHIQFFGRKTRQGLFLAGNRCGKTTSGAYEMTLHLTGRYPDWWPGRRFTKPVNVWAAGKINESTRDIIQKELLGTPGSREADGTKGVSGTGMIPRNCIHRITWKQGVADLVDTVQIKHISGGYSLLGLKTYNQGRGAFEGTAQDVIWFDEEPPADVYTEALTRTVTTNGIIYITFTPLEGLSQVIQSFLCDNKVMEGESDGKTVVTMTWGEAKHISEKAKEELLASFPPHEREARTKGVPALGSGAIYPVPEDEITCKPFRIPDYWPRAFGMDVGWKKTAVIWGALDRDSDILYLYSEHYMGSSEPAVHAAGIRARGDWINGVIDPAARGRSQVDGRQLYRMYLDLGLNLIPADNSVESGIYTVWQRMTTGRLKIFTSLTNTLSEYRIYRRDINGKIVKENDHLLDALRYLCVSGIPVMSQGSFYQEEYVPVRRNQKDQNDGRLAFHDPFSGY